MKKENIFILDTSVWIEYLRHGKGEIFDLMEKLIDENMVLLCGPVEMEILSGLRLNEQKQISEILNLLPFSNSEREDYRLAGKMFNDLKKKGISVPPIDCLIAAIAIRRGAKVLTLDKHFKYFDALETNL